jgi:23S rRNA (pseudouridine1915-N3)-methyltransferase
MRVTILNVGRVRQEFVISGEREYLQRLSAGLKVELLELGLESPDSMSIDETREREAVAIERKTAHFDYVIALDERGKQVNSEGFKTLLEARMNGGSKNVCFLIGGAYGLAERVRQAASYVLSLSALTFPHQLTRLILVEQIYRAQTMMKGVRYHK